MTDNAAITASAAMDRSVQCESCILLREYLTDLLECSDPLNVELVMADVRKHLSDETEISQTEEGS